MFLCLFLICEDPKKNFLQFLKLFRALMLSFKGFTNLLLQATLNRHFMRGGSHYPVGGSSEIAYNILPVIEGAGGRVLVRANVTNILERGGRVCGVRVAKGTETHEILAPIVISSAGQRFFAIRKEFS